MKSILALLSLLAVPGVAFAVSVPRSDAPGPVTSAVEASTLTSAAGGNATTAEDRAALAAPGNVFICNNANFVPYCVYIPGATNAQCVNLDLDLRDQVSSFGPDPGQRCWIFDNLGCTGENRGPIAFPGVRDLNEGWTDADGRTQSPFNDRTASYQCFFT